MKIVAPLLVVGVSACGSLSPVTCTDILVPGIRITVVDSVSATAVDAEGVRAIASEGVYADTATFRDRGPAGDIFVVDDRPGVYDVRVTAAGYAEWEQRAVRVSQKDRCHVQTVPLIARMQR